MHAFFKLTAAAASMAVASAQTFSNSTVPATSVLPGYQFLGCASISVTSFTTLQTSSSMTPELCASFSESFQYFAVSGSVCLGGSSANATTTVAQGSCNLRCPGNSAEICGGSSLTAKRQAAATFYSLYEQIAVIPTGTVTNIVISNVFVDINLDLGSLQTVTALSTAAVTGCGCKSQSIPTIPLTTTVVHCTVCDNPGPVTVTVPAGVTAGAAAAATVTVGANSAAAAAAAGGSGSAAAAAAAGGVDATAVAAAAAATGETVAYTGAASKNMVGGALALGALVLAL